MVCWAVCWIELRDNSVKERTVRIGVNGDERV